MTTEDTKNKALGRGLDALLGEDTEDYAELDAVRASKTVPVEFLSPGAYQPRHTMDADAIDDLAKSISEKGILQPILVRRREGEANAYEIIAGERRWRAAQVAKLHEVPVIIKDLNDRESLEIGLIENLQRQDLSPLEEAQGYQRLMDEFSNTQDGLAQSLGKSRSHVANMLRLLGLPDGVKTLLDDGALSAGHARALIGTQDPVKLAKKIVKQGLNVRQAEKLAKAEGSGTGTGSAGKSGTGGGGKSSDTLALERELAAVTGFKVDIRDSAGHGVVAVHYESLDQLDDLVRRLGQPPGGIPEADRGRAALAYIGGDAGDPLEGGDDDATDDDAVAEELASLGEAEADAT